MTAAATEVPESDLDRLAINGQGEEIVGHGVDFKIVISG